MNRQEQMLMTIRSQRDRTTKRSQRILAQKEAEVTPFVPTRRVVMPTHEGPMSPEQKRAFGKKWALIHRDIEDLERKGFRVRKVFPTPPEDKKAKQQRKGGSRRKGGKQANWDTYA